MQDNQAFRELFSLPPIQASTSTALTVPETPAPKAVTGDRELDAVLWLRDCIKTGHEGLIATALEAFEKIRTPADQLQKRYDAWLFENSAANSFGVFLHGMGFSDLAGLAQTSREQAARRHDALARFGGVKNLFRDTAAEAACKRALRGLKRSKPQGWLEYDSDQTDARFSAHQALAPHTQADCLHGMEFSTTLYWIRHACEPNAGDHWPAFQAHEDYCFRSLARIPPCSKEEALAVLEFLEAREYMDRDETPAILRNLVASGWT